MWSRIMEVLAWMQTNLINIHIAKGRRVTMDDVLPRGVRKKRRDESPPDFESPQEMKAWMRKKNEQRDDTIFWGSPDGQQVRDMLGIEEYEDGADTKES